MLLFFVMLFLAAPTIFAQRSSDSRLRCVEIDSGKTCLLYAASIIDIIANPDLFDGKCIRTFGYIHFEFE